MKTLGFQFFAFLLLVAVSCDDANSTSSCDATDPVTNLPWLRDRIAAIENNGKDLLLYRAMYKGQFVFYVVPCCTECYLDYWPPELYRCNGTAVEFESVAQVKVMSRIYITPGTTCSYD